MLCSSEMAFEHRGSTTEYTLADFALADKMASGAKLCSMFWAAEPGLGYLQGRITALALVGAGARGPWHDGQETARMPQRNEQVLEARVLMSGML